MTYFCRCRFKCGPASAATCVFVCEAGSGLVMASCYRGLPQLSQVAAISVKSLFTVAHFSNHTDAVLLSLLILPNQECVCLIRGVFRPKTLDCYAVAIRFLSIPLFTFNVALETSIMIPIVLFLRLYTAVLL